MLRIGTIAVLILLASFAALGQDLNAAADSTRSAPPEERTDTQSFHPRPSVFLPLSLGLIPHYQSLSAPSFSAAGKPLFLTTVPGSIALDAPWKLELQKANDYKTIGFILGTLEAGGAAYVAYEHLRKYGLK